MLLHISSACPLVIPEAGVSPSLRGIIKQKVRGKPEIYHLQRWFLADGFQPVLGKCLRLCVLFSRLWPYFMGFKIVSLQIKIGDYERPSWRISFYPILWGSKSSIWTISIFIFIFISKPVFAQNRGSNLNSERLFGRSKSGSDCMFAQAFMSDYCIWNIERV